MSTFWNCLCFSMTKTRSKHTKYLVVYICFHFKIHTALNCEMLRWKKGSVRTYNAIFFATFVELCTVTLTIFATKGRSRTVAAPYCIWNTYTTCDAAGAICPVTPSAICRWNWLIDCLICALWRVYTGVQFFVEKVKMLLTVIEAGTK